MHITIFYWIVKQKQVHELLLYVENIQNHYVNTKNNSKMHNTPGYAESLIKSEGSKVCKQVKGNIIRGRKYVKF